MTEVKTIMPLVAISNVAENRMPSTVLIMLKPTAARIVFLNERLSCSADSPGRTRSATTKTVPITFIESTIVVATSKSKASDSVLVGMPITRESSSSKTRDRSSLRKNPKNDRTQKPSMETTSKSNSSIVSIDPKR